MKKALELPAFRRLVAVATFNELAVSIGAVALALLVYRRTGSALGATAFFLCTEFGPAFFSPLLVPRLDQASVRGVLSLLYALEGLIFLILATTIHGLGVAPVLLLALIDGGLGLTARVLARSAWTSATAPAGLLREANALVNSSLAVCYMVGPALGGAVVAAGGTMAALWLNVGVFGVMAATMATAQGLPSAAAERLPTAGRLRAAFARARTEPMLLKLVGLQTVGMLFFTISIPVEVVFAQHTLHAGASGYGVLLAAWGAGAIVGSGLYARWRAVSSRRLITFGTLLLGAGFAVMAAAPVLGVAIAGASIAGVGNGVQNVAMRTATQEAIPPQLMALILSLNESIFRVVPGAGILLGGGIAALAGARVALAVAAAGSLVIALTVWISLAGYARLAKDSAEPDVPGPDSDLVRAIQQGSKP